MLFQSLPTLHGISESFIYSIYCKSNRKYGTQLPPRLLKPQMSKQNTEGMTSASSKVSTPNTGVIYLLSAFILRIHSFEMFLPCVDTVCSLVRSSLCFFQNVFAVSN